VCVCVCLCVHLCMSVFTCMCESVCHTTFILNLLAKSKSRCVFFNEKQAITISPSLANASLYVRVSVCMCV
jgi:hypothetical protein